MLHFQQNTVPAVSGQTGRQMDRQMDWSGEISGGMGRNTQLPGGRMNGVTGEVIDVTGAPLSIQPNMQNNMSPEAIESPTSLAESYKGSMNAMLSQNIGTYIVASFLVGTQGLVTWEGILYEVGNNYLTIYQESRDRYIVADIYSVKFVEFYDTRRRELCNSILQGSGWQETMV